MRLSHQNYDLLVSLIHGLLDCNSFDSFPEASLHAMQQAVRADRHSYNELDVSENRATMQSTPHVSGEEKLREHFYRHFTKHPVVAHTIRTGSENPRTISDFLSLRQFRNTAIYSDYYRYLGIKYQLSSYISQRPGFTVAFACNRSIRDFSERDKLMLDLLQPCLHKMYLQTKRQQQFQREAEIISNATSANGIGVVLLTEKLGVNWMTRQAWLFLEEYFTSERWGRWELPPTILRWLNKQSKQKSGKAESLSASLNVGGTAARLQVKVFRNPSGQSWLSLSERGGKLPSVLLANAGLTPREGEVFKWLVAGKTNPEIASILQISPRTVEKHLGRVFAKIGVENRFAAMCQANEWQQRPAAHN